MADVIERAPSEAFSVHRGRKVILIFGWAAAIACMVSAVAYPAFALPGFGSSILGVGTTLFASISGVMIQRARLAPRALDWTAETRTRTTIAVLIATCLAIVSWALGVYPIREAMFMCNDAKRINRIDAGMGVQSTNCVDARASISWWSLRSSVSQFECGGYDDDLPRSLTAGRKFDTCPKDPCRQPVGLAWDTRSPTVKVGVVPPVHRDLAWLQTQLQQLHDSYGFFITANKDPFKLVSTSNKMGEFLMIHLCLTDDAEEDCQNDTRTVIGVGYSKAGPDINKTAIHVIDTGIETGTFYLGSDGKTWCNKDFKAIAGSPSSSDVTATTSAPVGP